MSQQEDRTEYNPNLLRWHEDQIARQKQTVDMNEFCPKLYEVLWSYVDGWTSTSNIVNELYKLFEIDAVAFAYERGFRCFEEMLESKELEHVVHIDREQSKKRNMPSYYFEYTYRAALDKKYFNEIRHRVKQRRREIPSFVKPLQESSLENRTGTNGVQCPLIDFDAHNPLEQVEEEERDGENVVILNDDDEEMGKRERGKGKKTGGSSKFCSPLVDRMKRLNIAGGINGAMPSTSKMNSEAHFFAGDVDDENGRSLAEHCDGQKKRWK